MLRFLMLHCITVALCHVGLFDVVLFNVECSTLSNCASYYCASCWCYKCCFTIEGCTILISLPLNGVLLL